LSVREVEAIAQQEGQKNKPEKARKDGPVNKKEEKDADTRAMEKLLSDALGMRVDIHHDSGRGEVRVTYQSLDQLDALCRILSS
jgi:ParB family chromosome partitioning protein